jgi:hypothetical protein
MVAKTDLSLSALSVGDREPVIGPPPIPGPLDRFRIYNRLRGAPSPERDLAEISLCTKSRRRSNPASGCG